MKKQEDLNDGIQTTGLITERKRTDVYAIWATLIILVTFGLVMIYSASSIQFMRNDAYENDSMYLLKKQAVFVLLGMAACFAGQFLNYNMLFRYARLIYFIGIGSIFLLITPLGVSAKGATRWINILGIQFQVAEVVKICVIVILAYMVQRHSEKMDKLHMVFRMWCIGGIAVVLLLKISNDLSSSLVVLGITFGITFVYTKNIKVHLAAAGLGMSAATLYVLSIWRNMPTSDELANMSFRVGRIAAWLDPERYAGEQGYQTLQALYAIGSGGFWGKGLGNSIQKISAIPEAQNDMIFSIICEELGVFGAASLIFLILYLCWHIFLVAYWAKNVFGSVLITGVLLHISLQSFMNIGVNVNVLPNTGIGLPFISYGGTAVFCQLAEMALVLSVGRIANGEKSVTLFKRKRRRKF